MYDISFFEGGSMAELDSTENRKKMCQIYNELSKELFGFGTTLLRVTVDQRVITFHAKHRRSPRSTALEGEAPELKQEVDFRMSLLFKKKFKERLEDEMGLNIEVLLRDYDAPTQWAFTNMVLAGE